MKRLLSAVFLFSGLSALIYQVVWQRLLATYYGVGPVSIALIVSVYIAGLGFGALVGGYLSERLTRSLQHKINSCDFKMRHALFARKK